MSSCLSVYISTYLSVWLSIQRERVCFVSFSSFVLPFFVLVQNLNNDNACDACVLTVDWLDDFMAKGVLVVLSTVRSWVSWCVVVVEGGSSSSSPSSFALI